MDSKLFSRLVGCDLQENHSDQALSQCSAEVMAIALPEHMAATRRASQRASGVTGSRVL